MRIFLTLILCCLFLNSEAAEYPIVRRAAYDIGSGKIKVKVADVDVKANRIVKTYFAESINVELREDLAKSPDRKFSREMQGQVIEAIQQLAMKSAPFNPEASHAIATESLRFAANGQELASKIESETGVKVSIVSQEEEGILGFLTAAALAGADPDKVVSLDFGGGSFQVAAKIGERYLVYQGRIGIVPLRNAILKYQESEMGSSSSPISPSQMEWAIQFVKESVTEVPEDLIHKLSDREVVVLSIGANPLWTAKGKVLDYNLHRIQNELQEKLSSNDKFCNSEEKDVLTILILACGVLESFGMDEIRYVGGGHGGNASGVMLSPQYWD